MGGGVLVKIEEVEWFKEGLPFLCYSEHVCTDRETSLELLLHYIACGVGHVECGVLLGVCWCDDGHQMVPV